MHTLTWNPETNAGLCSCRMTLILSSSQAEAATAHANHIESEKISPTDPAKVWLAQTGRRAWSGWYQGGYVA